tara:strand:- start:405 stop:770 length:366 start_codon:yes stop_codon:yes gene_type:complete
MSNHKHKFSKAKTTSHNQKKPFDPNKYGKLWGNIGFELADKQAHVEQGTQPIIGFLCIDNRKIGITWSETNRIIETMADAQHRHNVANRLGMLEKGLGTPRDIKFKQYDTDGKVIATNIKE